MSPELAAASAVYTPRQDERLIASTDSTVNAFEWGINFVPCSGFDAIGVTFSTNFAGGYEHLSCAFITFGVGVFGFVYSSLHLVPARSGKMSKGIFKVDGDWVATALVFTNPVGQIATRSMRIYGIPEYKGYA